MLSIIKFSDDDNRFFFSVFQVFSVFFGFFLDVLQLDHLVVADVDVGPELGAAAPQAQLVLNSS